MRGNSVRSLLLLAVLSTWPGVGQQSATTADLAGRVTDASGGVLPGATVVVTSLQTGISRTVVTEPDGRFTVAALAPGKYSLEASLSGFTRASMPSIHLALGTRRELDVVLTVAGVSEAVTVEGTGGVEPAATALSHVLARPQIDGLPINSRNFIAFSRLTPTVALDRTPQQGASASSGLSFAGQRARANNITVDGLDNNDTNIGAVRATFSQDAVQ